MTVCVQAAAIPGQIPTNALCAAQEDDRQNQRQDSPHRIEDEASR